MSLTSILRLLTLRAHVDSRNCNGAVKAAIAFLLFSIALTTTKGIYAQEAPSAQVRIIGGVHAELGEWPSLVALVVPGDVPLRFRQFCAGSVVAERWVLTAAHCMFNLDGSVTTPDQIRIVAGINDLNDVSAIETVVTNVFVHPQYENLTIPINDIALLELGTSVPVPQNALLEGSPEAIVGRTAFIAGWGAITEQGPVNSDRFPNLLQEAAIPIVSRAQCNLPASYNGGILATQLCAGFQEGGVDSCQGDSGGPIYIVEGTRQIQVGITSFGAGCARPDLYGVYTNVDAYRSWMSSFFSLSGAAVSSQSAISGESNDFAGSMNPLFLALLVVFSFRMTTRTPSKIRRRRIMPLLLALITASACSSNSVVPVNANANKMTYLKNSAAAIDTVSGHDSSASGLSLNSENGKPGLNQMRLGIPRVEAVHVLASLGFDAPVCDVDKTSMKGTGRLFLREKCNAKPLRDVSLEGLPVSQLKFQLVDDRLIKLEVSLLGGDSMALASRLNERYEHVPSLLQPLEWRMGGDHIRLVTSDSSVTDGLTDMSLQMIDGRLKEKLPKLFDYP